jgi:hypothetical protein
MSYKKFFGNFGRLIRSFTPGRHKSSALLEAAPQKREIIISSARKSFYQDRMSNALRFGDILKGYIFTAPQFENPEDLSKYIIDVSMPEYCVILSPCCSIRNNTILLAPLKKVLIDFYDNPYFKEDLTRINREMEPQETVSPDKWKKIHDEEKQRRLAEGRTYALHDYFVFSSHELLPEYPLNVRGIEPTTGFYMIDFRDTHKVKCNLIKSPEKSPLSTKLLELTVRSREELRQKIKFYYGHPPDEDKPYLNY